MSANKGGNAMNSHADRTPHDPQSDRHARARVKMRRALRKRGGLGPTAHLPAPALVELMKEFKPKEIDYSQRMRGNYRTNRPQWIEVSLGYYLATLNNLPPLKQLSLGHIMGEQFGYNGSGDSVWLCFLQVSDRHRQTRFLGKICTIEQWRAAYLGATYEHLMRITPRTCDECSGKGHDSSSPF